MVLGMHRSGTSAATRALGVLGVELGENFLPPQPDNPKGFFEDIDVYSLNVDMLDSLQRQWDSLRPLTDTDWEILRTSGYLQKAVSMLSDKLKDHSCFGIKDPRLARLLPFWQDAAKMLDLDVCYLISIRNPLSVRDSLAARDHADPVKTYLLWLIHVVESLFATNGMPRSIVDFDRLMVHSKTELTRISEELSLPFDESKFESYSSEFLDSDLRHSKYGWHDLLQDDDCPNLAREAYFRLLQSASGNFFLEDPSMASAIEEWVQAITNLEPMFRLIDRFDLQSRSLAAELEACKSRTRQLEGLVTSQLARLNDFETRENGT